MAADQVVVVAVVVHARRALEEARLLPPIQPPLPQPARSRLRLRARLAPRRHLHLHQRKLQRTRLVQQLDGGLGAQAGLRSGRWKSWAGQGEQVGPGRGEAAAGRLAQLRLGQELLPGQADELEGVGALLVDDRRRAASC